MVYSIAQLASKTVNLLTLQSIIRQGMLQKALKTASPTIITTVLSQTHIQNAQELASLQQNKNIRIVPYYAPLLYAHHASSLHFQTTQNPPRLSLLLGRPTSHFLAQADGRRIVTLEELCQALPEKVPLSMRSRDNQVARQKLEERLGMPLGGQRGIEFENILVVADSIPMWDEAFQVALDCQPAPIIIPYTKQSVPQDQLYRLTLSDFLRGLKTTHKVVSSAVKTHPPLKVQRFDQKKQLNWILSHVASQTQEMGIDSFFFTDPPAIQSCNGKVRVLDSLKEIL